MTYEVMYVVLGFMFWGGIVIGVAGAAWVIWEHRRRR